MNILHVIDQLSMTHGGGSAKMAYQLSEAQAAMGHRVWIHTSTWRMDGQKAPEGVTVRACKIVGSPFGLRCAPRLALAFPEERKVNIIHLHNYRTLPNLVYGDMRTPYVLEPHGSIPLTARYCQWAHNRFWRSAIFDGASAYIANSDLEIPQYRAEGADLEQITVIPPGIDWREFEALPPKRPMPYKTILSLGRLHPIKGVDLLIEAFKLLNRNDVRLVIAGNTEDESYYQQLVALAGKNKHIDFVGPLYGKVKIQAYVDADLYVLPSRYEMFGVTILEALACGTPVVAMVGHGSTVNGLPRYLGLVSPHNVTALTIAIRTVLDSDVVGGSTSRRTWAREYAWDRLAQRHIRVYEGVLR